MLKGKFIQPIIYNLYKKGVREFKLDKYFNIRKTESVKSFIDCIFHVHNGKFYVFNDPIIMKINLKDYKYRFKLGQYSYNKQINVKHSANKNLHSINKDLKKKKGILIKSKKSKKFIFTKK